MQIAYNYSKLHCLTSNTY